MKKLEFHPLLKDVPMMPLQERDALASDIKENGQRIPIVLFNGKIIDGRNRYLACLARNIEPTVVAIDLKDPKQYVASLNYFRKHWTTAERAHFAALMSLDSERGSPESNAPNGAIPSVDKPITQEIAAKQMGVSRRSVQRSKAKIRGKSNEQKTAKDSRQDSEGEPTDDSGRVLPDGSARQYWSRREEAQGIMSAMRSTVKSVKAIDSSDPMYCEVNLNGVLSDLRNATNRFASAIPAHVCPYCKGMKPDNCKACKGRGVVSEYFWKTAVPTEMKPDMPF